MTKEKQAKEWMWHLYQVFPSDPPLAEALRDLLKVRDNYIKARIKKHG